MACVLIFTLKQPVAVVVESPEDTYGVQHRKRKVDYSDPVHTGSRAVTGVFKRCGKEPSDFRLGDIIRFNMQHRCHEHRHLVFHYAKVTKINKRSIVITDIMFIPEMKQEESLPIKGLCGYVLEGKGKEEKHKGNLQTGRSIDVLV